MFLAGTRSEPGGGGSGNFIIVWDAPETDADGGAVATVTSHKVYWSQDILDRENAANSATVAMPTLTYTATSLASGTWYAWVAAITANGESDVSPPFEETVA